MGNYFRRPEMMEGRGFRCYNCGKMLALKVEGSNYEIKLLCPRCKARIKLEMREPLGWKKKPENKDEVKPKPVTAQSQT